MNNLYINKIYVPVATGFSLHYRENYLFLIAFAVFVLIIIFALIWQSRKKRKTIEKFLVYLNVSRVFSLFSIRYAGNFDGSEILLDFIPAGKNTPPYIKIRFKTFLPFNLKVTRKTIFTKLGASLGLIKEFKTNNPEFDNEFCVSTNNEMFALSFFSSSTTFELIKELFLMGFEYFQIKSGTIEIQKPYENLEDELKQQKMLSTLRILQSLSKV